MKLGSEFSGEELLDFARRRVQRGRSAGARFQRAAPPVRSRVARGSKIGSTVSSRTILRVNGQWIKGYLRKLQV